MIPSVLRALEFDRVRERLAHHALTPLGRDRALVLEPATEPDAVRAALALTGEGAAFVQAGGSLGVYAPDDVHDTIARLDLEEEPLDPGALLGLSRCLASVDTVVAAIRRADRPGLRAVALRASSFADETAAVARAIEPSGDVSDRASPALRDIRENLRRQRARLRSSLEALTRGRDTAKYLQDQIVTDRNGRYVVVVRAEHRDAIPGIVHGSSTSGASLYLEPLSTVSLNNDIVALVERERAEIRRILIALTNAFRARRDDLDGTLDAAAELDELHAKVTLAQQLDGTAPEIVDDGRIEFLGARHPLLGGPGHSLPVPSDLRLIPPDRALVISGPNTGGKTVALKAFGLLALMAQAGLLIPVERGSRFTPFRSIFADIGDEQSIAASLSTFSAHIVNIVGMDRDLQLPSLVLLDEIGGGTDPVEGGALGAALVDHFRQRGAVVVATSHDDTVKSYAMTTAGVMSAGFGFNPDTYTPTYRLVYGVPGRSLALEIAERLGVPPGVITDARARQSGRESQLAAHLARLDREFVDLDRERMKVDADRQAVVLERAGILERETRLTEREAVLKRRLDDRVNEKLRDARAEVDRIVGTLKQKADTLAQQAERRGTPRLTTGDIGSVRADARAALDAVAGASGASESAADASPLTAPPSAGDRVYVASLNAEGVVRTVSGKQVEVDVRGKRVRVKATDLRAGRPEGAAPAGGSTRVATSVSPRAATELIVIGATVDEALDRAAKFLDDAILADERRLRVVHGHGTGRLRAALTTFFREQPTVASVSQAPEREGGAGATIVELKD